MGQTGYGNSPYQTLSDYAGGYNYIDLDLLIEEGYLNNDEVIEYEYEKIDYSFLYKTRLSILKKAYKRFNVTKEYLEFCKNEWLESYSIFMAKKELYFIWTEYEEYVEEDTINFYKFIQFIFYKQWNSLKLYANERGIKIIGDIPMYSAFDSCDVYYNKNYYQIDSNELVNVAGCPPDGYSDDGQIWGNPLYNWDNIIKDDCTYIKNKISHYLNMYDLIRLDHFRGYINYFSIPIHQQASDGIWLDGPKHKLFDKLKLDKEKVIVEDLGFITKEVEDFIKEYKFTTMRVMQFGFDLDSKNIHISHNYDKNCVCYSSTHDNLPINGWKKYLTNKEVNYVCNYLNSTYKDINKRMIEDCYKSVAKIVIINIQDLLELDECDTLNVPGTSKDNWTWKLEDGQYEHLKIKLINLVKKYNR